MSYKVTHQDATISITDTVERIEAIKYFYISGRCDRPEAAAEPAKPSGREYDRSFQKALWAAWQEVQWVSKVDRYEFTSQVLGIPALAVTWATKRASPSAMTHAQAVRLLAALDGARAAFGV